VEIITSRRSRPALPAGTRPLTGRPAPSLHNLLDVVAPVDYLDERKFAQVAAAKAQPARDRQPDLPVPYVDDRPGSGEVHEPFPAGNGA
jgi:hypothetical protein